MTLTFEAGPIHQLCSHLYPAVVVATLSVVRAAQLAAALPQVDTKSQVSDSPTPHYHFSGFLHKLRKRYSHCVQCVLGCDACKYVSNRMLHPMSVIMHLFTSQTHL